MLRQPSGRVKILKNVDAVILAGGQSSRMGVPTKALLQLGNTSLLDHVTRRLACQVNSLSISGSQEYLGNADYPIIEDAVERFSGPLAGLYSAMIFPQVSDSDYLLVVPCDGPFLPNNLVSELYTQITSEDADIACVRYQKVNQTTFSLWHRRGLPAIETALVKNNNGGFKPLLSELTTTYLDWPEEEINPFFNINTPDDLSFAEAIICR